MVNQKKMNADLTKFITNYHAPLPFSNRAIDAFLNPDAIQEITQDFLEITNNIWTHYVHFSEKKLRLTTLGLNNDFICSYLHTFSKTKHN